MPQRSTLSALLIACAVLIAAGLALLISGPGAQATSAVPNHPLGTPTPCTGWSVVSSPNVGTTFDNYLYGAAAVSAMDVWAVGYYFDADNYAHTLTEHWNGSAWSVIPSPDPGTLNNFLFAATAISANDVWAVGWFQNTSIQQTLTMHWNGSTWSVVPLSNPAPPRTTLFGVVGAATNDVWAVGQGCDSPLCNTRVPVTLRWDGTAWSNVPVPNVPPWDNSLYNVFALTASDVWAVGVACTGNGCPTSQTLVEHWNGTVWTITPSPNPGAAHSFLNAVAAQAANDVWAVGQTCADAGCSAARSLIERWDGSTWTQVASPNPGTTDTHLNAVAVASANDAWAVGSATSDGSTYNNAVMHWDGSNWTAISGPSPGAIDNHLRALALVSANDIWAAGDQDSGSGERTQLQHYVVPCSGTPTATVTATSTAAASTPTPSATPCTISFSDVHPGDYFYTAVQYLACHGVISGYADGTFRPYNNTTRGQLTKIVVLAEGWQVDCPQNGHFTDVPPTDPFYCYVETAYGHAIISGYADGTFRPGNNVTRTQLCKIIVLAEGWANDCPLPGHFLDVPPTDPFFCYVETAYNHNIISGYSDGTFRPSNNATRGHISKIVYQAITQP